METDHTVQESALHAGRQAWWPLDTMACSLDDASTISISSSSSSFLLGWDPQLCYFGLGARGAGAGHSDIIHAGKLELLVPKRRSRSACLQGLHFLFRFPWMQLVSMAVTLWLCPCVLGMESPVSEASTAAATGWTTQKDAMAMPDELDELLMVSAVLISVNLNLPCISCGRSDFGACILSLNSCCFTSSEPVGLGQGAGRGLQFLQRSEEGECHLFPM